MKFILLEDGFKHAAWDMSKTIRSLSDSQLENFCYDIVELGEKEQEIFYGPIDWGTGEPTKSMTVDMELGINIDSIEHDPTEDEDDRWVVYTLTGDAGNMHGEISEIDIWANPDSSLEEFKIEFNKSVEENIEKLTLDEGDFDVYEFID